MAGTGKPIHCRAAIARSPGEPLVIEEVTVAAPKPREVRIKIICASVCPVDVTFWESKHPSAIFPIILGHEAMGEYTVVDIAHVTKIDPQTPPDRACLFTCGVAAGVGAAVKRAKVEAGTSVAIFGLGVIGLAVAEGARLCGATRIIGVDMNPDKYEIGKKFGVTDFVNSSSCVDKPVSQVIIEMTGGGADYCFECVGSTSLVHEAYASCRKAWGKTVVLGVDQAGAMLTFNSYDVLDNGRTLMGGLFGGLKPKSDIPILIKRYMAKELKLDEFITHEVDFKDINKAFDLLLEGKSLQCVIWMNK
ncbi:hypothetical protein QVD17_32278 [Tagetes erecta]|uniref:Alcohol dehydrogenase n=1 Tax=Tagetes erecta TaxID=13708 RepID=A0AAD8K9C6_TARER|nr:hypothetical protein QVD17_32278 [Tagetes erecta]